LIIEPKGHVTVEEFTRTIFIAKENCFATIKCQKHVLYILLCYKNKCSGIETI